MLLSCSGSTMSDPRHSNKQQNRFQRRDEQNNLRRAERHSAVGGTAGVNCIKIGLPGKSILGDYFQENRTSRRPFLLLRFDFPGRPIFIQFVPASPTSVPKLGRWSKCPDLRSPWRWRWTQRRPWGPWVTGSVGLPQSCRAPFLWFQKSSLMFGDIKTHQYLFQYLVQNPVFDSVTWFENRTHYLIIKAGSLLHKPNCCT